MTRSAALPPTRFVATLLAAALTSLLLLAITPAPAPAAPAPENAAVQMDIFRKCLDLLHFKPLKAFADLDPKDCVLVMLGDTSKLTDAHVPGGLKHFLVQGGAALIASDEPMRPASHTALFDATGWWITGDKWSFSPQPDLWCYHKIDFCPILIFAPWEPRFDRDPNTQEEIKPVATNVPSRLARFKDGRALEPFAYLPKNTEFGHPRPKDEAYGNPCFGVSGDVGQGRVIVLADHSIFINEMMKPKDTGNAEFTYNCLKYLSGEQGQRKRVLFVDDGVIQQSFLSATKAPKPSPVDTALALLDKAITKAQDKLNQQQDQLNEIDQRDGFNQAFTQLQQQHPYRWRRAIVILLVVVTLGLLIYGCYRLGIIARYRTEIGVLPLGRAARQQAPRSNLLTLRQEGLLEADNVWEASRQLARDAFEAGGVAAPLPYREPAVKVPNASWWRRSQIQRRVLELWRLAFRNRPMPLAPHALLALAAELEQLKADLKRGTIQVA